MLKAAWPECVSKGNESNRAIVTSEIISIAKEIGGESFDDFGGHDIEELLVDEALNDDDILESMVDITKDLETVDSEPEEDVTPLDEKLLREGLQLSAGVHYRLFSVWTLVPVRLDQQLSDHSTVDEIASGAADCRLTYTMANCLQMR
ncbi:uncharacterized protein TNCV_4732731 [Trichonephila clavipes]|nr:uncharacterized protein TNCV_4732731 [Trichonephila clavipes]